MKMVHEQRTTAFGMALLIGLGAAIGFGSGAIGAVAATQPTTPIAKTETEAAFVRAAINSCKLAMAKGVTEVMGDTKVVYPPMATRDGFYDHTAVATNIDGKTVANPFDFWQPLCFPADMNDSLKTVIKLHLKKNASFRHKFAKKNASTFLWTQHMGAPDWSIFTYTVKNSLIVGFSGATWNQTNVFYGK